MIPRFHRAPEPVDVPEPAVWQPGDALHRNPHVSHQSGFFSFRDDTPSTLGPGVDAARWPEGGTRPLKPGDELGDFIAEHHEMQRRLANRAAREQEDVA